MNKLLNLLGRRLPLVVILLLTSFFGAAAGLYWDVPGRIQSALRSGDAQPASSGYACPMHPEIISAQAGKCPKCGVALTRGSGPQPARAGCGSAGESQAHGCCARPQAGAMTLPPGHPPVPGMETHAGCARSPVPASPSEKE